MPGPQPAIKPGYDNAGRKLSVDPVTTATRGPNRRSVFQSYQALPRPARIAISGSFFLFALAGYYYEPYVMPLPSHASSTGGFGGPRGGDVLVDAREGERVPVRLMVVDRSVSRGQ
ncbi:hypothetical protein NCC49_004142 [Naganishia albida]|nr:hypothetical protein NCC49_004142 [Naganishia albida]